MAQLVARQLGTQSNERLWGSNPGKGELLKKDPSQDSSVGSKLAWYQSGPGFKTWQRRDFFNENK